MFYPSGPQHCLSVPLVAPVAVAAGYPSPAQDYFDGRIDLNAHMVKDVTTSETLDPDRPAHPFNDHLPARNRYLGTECIVIFVVVLRLSPD